MWHDFLDFALGIVSLAVGGLTVRFLRSFDDLSETKEKHSREIQNTRSAIARIEGHLNLTPFTYPD